MNEANLKQFVNKKKCTLLGVGPMSLNCVDAAIELSNDNNVPIMLIASRRQIDSKEFGGGYVNNWNTYDFANYVKSRDTKNNIILARDHGGPWQNTVEVTNKLDAKKAMESAMRSLKQDIDAGFGMLHLDPSIDIHENLLPQNAISRLFELYEFCSDYAKSKNIELIFEVGTEEQNGSTNTPEQLEDTLQRIKEFCERNKFTMPSFVVIQSGTKVMEMRNIGSFESPLRVEGEIAVEIQVPKMIEICNKYSIFMKAHNADYLSDESLSWHPKLGIHSINVAPEFGVVETKKLFNMLSEFGFKDVLEDIMKISYNSRKWEKWMLPESNASDMEKATISGHYIFSNNEYIDKINFVKKEFFKKNINLNECLKLEVKKSIFRYIKNLGMVH